MLLRRPQRVALLAYLAIASRDGFARRDRILAMFWPDQNDERARHALRQALHGLRTSLDRAVFVGRGDQEISLDSSVLRCDAAEVERLLDAGQPREALEQHRGELLAGFFITGAPEFERWLDGARERLRMRCTAAAAALTTEAEERGDPANAVHWARRTLEISPTDERALRRLLVLLDGAGDRAGALLAHQQFERRHALEFETEPTPETQALARQLRGPAPAAATPKSRAAAAPETVPHPPTAKKQNWVTYAAGGAAIVASLALFFSLRQAGASGDALPGRSSVALSLYAEGRQAWMHQDHGGAERLMRAALAEDSTFALAMLHLGHVIGVQGRHAEAQTMQAAAAALAPSQSDHERLLVLTWYAENYSDPRFKVLAETLAIRYPDDLEGQLFLAHARRYAGDMLGAIEPLRRVIARDTGFAREPIGSECPACRAYRDLVDVLENADSLPAAEAAAREWTVLRPNDAPAWEMLSYELAIQDRYTEALAARQRASDLQRHAADPLGVAEILLRAGDFRTIAHIVEPIIRNGSIEQISSARYVQWQSYREQGRMREALAVARSMDVLVRREAGIAPIANIMHAQSLYETGRYAEAARIWDSVATRSFDNNTPASGSRNRTMALSHAADARAALGDTAMLVKLLDSVRVYGEQSGYGRDWLMRHHVHGLLLATRGNSGAACDAFHRSLFTASAAYIRANLALGRACIAANRPADALVPLRGVLRGPTGAAGTYGTHTEAHELIAQAFDALGAVDSARVHYTRVATAWSGADPAFRARGEVARVRAMALRGVQSLAR